MLRRFASVFHPILFAAFPLLSLFEHNQSEVELSVVWVPLALSVAGAAALYAIFLLVFRHAAKAGALAALVAFAFFYYGTFAATIGLADRWFFPLWAALFVLGAVTLVRTRSDLANLTLVLGVSALVLIVRPVAGIAIYHANHPVISASDARLWPTRLPRPRLPSAARRPDIYFLIPDDYARPDVLRHHFRYDDSVFLGQLRKRGFVLSDQARSPYSDSEMNIAAAVNMDYLSRLPSILGRKSQDVRPVSKLIEDNRAARLLRSLGYRYVHLDTDEVTFSGGNPHISRLAAPDSFANLWLRNSVLRLIGGKLGFDDHGPIARGQIESEDAAIALATDLAILDTDLVSTVVYCEHYFGRCPAWIEAEARARAAELYLVLKPDIPWVADGVRDRGDRRDEMHDLFRQKLDDMGLRYVDIGGERDERFSRAVRAITSLMST